MAQYSPGIQEALSTLPYLRRLYGDEAALSVSTRDEFVYYESGKRLNHGIRPGDPLKKGGVSDRAILTGQRVSENVSAQLFGFPFLGLAVPVFEGREIVGSLTVGMPAEIEDKLQDMARRMNTGVEAVSAGSTGFAASAEQLAATSSELAANTDKIREHVKDMDAIISLIMEIATQTHLLGLNAAIEAARAGDMGRGFNVVAEEIRKLAGRTQSSAKEVTQKLTRIKNNIDVLAEHVFQVSSVSQEQAATSEEISAGIHDLEPMARGLIELAAELVK